jgi:hypothetical protein
MIPTTATTANSNRYSGLLSILPLNEGIDTSRGPVEEYAVLSRRQLTFTLDVLDSGTDANSGSPHTRLSVK